jgi:hypothetical protein
MTNQHFGDFLVANNIIAIEEKNIRHAIPLELVA